MCYLKYIHFSEHALFNPLFVRQTHFKFRLASHITEMSHDQKCGQEREL